MTEPESYNLSAIRKLLLTAFNAQELRDLFHFVENPELGPVVHEFADDEGLSAMVFDGDWIRLPKEQDAEFEQIEKEGDQGRHSADPVGGSPFSMIGWEVHCSISGAPRPS